VALIAQLENVLGPLWVWLAGLERPSLPTIIGGVIVIGAVALQVTQGSQASNRSVRGPAEIAEPLAPHT